MQHSIHQVIAHVERRGGENSLEVIGEVMSKLLLLRKLYGATTCAVT